MFNVWKARRELCKAHNVYRKKAESFLFSDLYNHEEYKQLQDIRHAIAYVLCEYFDFNYKFYYDNFPFNYKWFIAYDYIEYYNECKEAYEKLAKQNKTNHNYKYIAWSIDDFKNHYCTKKRDVIYNMANRCLYMYDGKNFINMC